MKPDQTPNRVSRGRELFEDAFQLLLELSQRGPGPVSEMLFPNVFPEMFHRIEFGRVGGLKKDANVFKLAHVFAAMPGRLIHHHNQSTVFKLLGKLLEKELHGGRIGKGQD